MPEQSHDQALELDGDMSSIRSEPNYIIQVLKGLEIVENLAPNVDG